MDLSFPTLEVEPCFDPFPDSWLERFEKAEAFEVFELDRFSAFIVEAGYGAPNITYFEGAEPLIYD